ncbi:MAG: aromatic acid exporter family protein [Clostridiales bacterium]|nr:aromatic acid exporter family protein [Clostridiales bacterium]
MEKVKLFWGSKRETLIKGAKIAVGASLAIVICSLFGFDYASSAGIITLLTIQNTTRATLRLSIDRFFSFALSMAIAFGVCALYKSTASGFCIYMLLMVILSFLFGWENTVSTNAVFGTHIFITEQAFTLNFVFNELGLLFVGVVIAVLFNLKMPKKEKEIREDISFVEKTMAEIVFEMSEKLRSGKAMELTGEKIADLSARLDTAVNRAIANRDNTLQNHTEFYINFFTLRKNQCAILESLYKNLGKVGNRSFNADITADFLKDLSESFSIQNDVTLRINKLEDIIDSFKSKPLPKSYPEFEETAILYYILKSMEDFFTLKRDFISSLSEEQMLIYLNRSKH